MGSRLNFKSFGDGLSDEMVNPKQQPTMGSGIPLTRQNSVFTLTFDEFQNSWGGGIGKDFGSMNMDELLKNIWTAEENHSMMSNNTNFNNNGGNISGNTVINNNNGGLPVVVGGESGFYGGGSLQRQGSLTLPRTLSQKTVDDVWKELMKEDDPGNGVVGNGGTSGGIPQRQQTLGEMTLEEFLVRAGVVREESQPVESVDNFNGGFYGFGGNAFVSNQPHGTAVRPDLLTTQTQPLQMQQKSDLLTTQTQPLQMQQRSDLLKTQTKPLQMVQRPDLLTSQTQPLQMVHRPDLLTTQTQPLKMVQQQQQLMQTQERPFPKQTTIAFSNTVDVVDNRSQPVTQVTKSLENYNHLTKLDCQEVKPSILGVRDYSTMNNNRLQGVDFKTGVSVAAVSPGSQMSPDLTPKSAMDASLSPVPYMFGRVRKTGAVLEKVIERRQKRMIKNRESAARSRARKQAYTLELEAEVAQLKELNEELQRKQVEIIEKQKKQLMEPMRQPLGCKRQCLRRTLTGPW